MCCVFNGVLVSDFMRLGKKHVCCVVMILSLISTGIL